MSGPAKAGPLARPPSPNLELVQDVIVPLAAHACARSLTRLGHGTSMTGAPIGTRPPRMTFLTDAGATFEPPLAVLLACLPRCFRALCSRAESMKVCRRSCHPIKNRKLRVNLGARFAPFD